MATATLTTPRSNSASEASRIPELDGLRGVAILAVMIFHFGSAPLQPGVVRHAIEIGWCGVDLFFVLSGFLITGILIRTKSRNRYFYSFYSRRILRIFPLYYGCLLVIFALIVPFAHTPITGLRHEASWYWLHLSNFRSAWGPFSISPVGHFWSLAVEEQFYLVWPLIVLLLPERVLLWVCLAAPVASTILRSLPVMQEIERTHPEFLYRITFCRLDGLALGGCAAILARHEKLTQLAAPVARVLAPLSAVVLAGIIVADGSTLYSGRWMSSVGYSVVALLFASCLFLTVIRRIRGDFFRSPWLMSFGKYSYGLYMFHVPVLFILTKLFLLTGPKGSIVLLTLGTAVSYVAAYISWHIYEARFLRLKDRFTPAASAAASN